MSNLKLAILEHICSEPAHRFPIIFLPELNPIQDCQASPSEVFSEVVDMESRGLINAYLNKGVGNTINTVEVKYLTYQGKVKLMELTGKTPKRNTLFAPQSLTWLLFILCLIILIIWEVSSYHPHSRHHDNEPLPPPIKPTSQY
jgi:hypothetical protein